MSKPFVIAIQCRTGSTRLPGKMTRSFFEEQTILQIMVAELLSEFESTDVVIATSDNTGDDEIARVASGLGVACSRGSENDVLDRVWTAVQDRRVDLVARVCADNPFLRASLLKELLELDVEFDYASFQTSSGKPTILSHLGLFAEVVAHETLRTLHETATSRRHREHLTSHILDHPDQYDRKLLAVPNCVSRVEGLRLTVDTESDFVTSQQLYQLVHAEFGPRFRTEELMSVVERHPELLENMANEITANAKG